MELKSLPGIIILIVVFIIIIIVGVSIVGTIYKKDSDSYYSSYSTSFVSDTYNTITNLNNNKEGVSVSRLNDTWLEFIDNNLTLQVSQTKATIYFWFKNATTNWMNIVQSDGQNYTNGVLNNNWVTFPFYVDGNNITLGMINNARFINCSIDKFIVYDKYLSDEQILEAYNEGH